MRGDFGDKGEVFDTGGVHEKELERAGVAGISCDHDVGGFAVTMLEATAFEGGEESAQVAGEESAFVRRREGVIREKGAEVEGGGDFFTKEDTLLKNAEFSLADGGEWESGGDFSDDQGVGGEVLPVGV